MYRHGYLIEKTDEIETQAFMQNAYFNRSLQHCCSHTTTPNDPENCMPGAVISESIGYIAWNIFDEYREHGAYHHKRLVCDMLDKLLGENKTLSTTLGSNGVVTLMQQEKEKRYINHLLYAVTKLRGTVDVIEDASITVDTSVSIRIAEKPKHVYLAPDERDIPFTYENGILKYMVDRFVLHIMAVIEL